MSAKRKRSPPVSDTKEVKDHVISESDPIDDRSSRFVAYFSPTKPPKELQRFVSLSGASHSILGWRRESNQQSLTSTKQYVSGHDDDGEQYGGRRVEGVLKTLGVTGACVVARWYGGVMLGPVRFEHMENVARQAVERWVESMKLEEAKRRKVEQEEKEKPVLVDTLKQRDASIAVLRKMATEKEAKAKEARGRGDGETVPEKDNVDGQKQEGQKPERNATATVQVPVAAKLQPAVDYESLSVDRLKALEKTRDATLSFLLKRIDKAEAETASDKDDAGR